MKHNFVLPALASALFVACHFHQTPTSAQTTPTSAQTAPAPPVAPEPIAVALQIAPNPARRGTLVGFSLTAHNTTQATQTLRFSSGQSFDITATPEAAKTEKDAGWRWSHGKIFTMALRTEKLAPGQAKTWTATWNQSDDQNVPLPRGKYTIAAWITANGGLKAAPATLELAD